MDKIQRFLNSDGRVTQWPAKRAMQTMVLEYLASKFDPNKTYTEREVNEVLNNWHTFGDWAILRRALVDNQLLQRDRNGAEYHRTITNSASK